MGLPLLAIGQAVGSSLVSYFMKKAAKAASEEFIHKMLDTAMEHLGPWVIGWLEKKAAKTETSLDDVGVGALKKILEIGDK